MNKKSKVSIIIPVYNGEKYIYECLQSVINQTYNELEIIVVNDGSTDNSVKICTDLARRDSRIIVYSKINGGISDARNFGVKRSTGDYIFFLDSDDVILENTIDILIKSLKNDNCIIVCNNERFIKNYHKKEKYNIKRYSPYEYFLSILSLSNQTYAWGCLIPKKLLGNNFFIKNRYFEDIASMYKLYNQCESIYKISAKLYKYRINPNSIVNTKKKKILLDYIKSSNEMIDYIRTHYNVNKRLLLTYRAAVYRNAYSMSNNKYYLDRANKIIKYISYKNISVVNKIKLVLLNSKTITKILLNIKRSIKCNIS